MLREWGFWRLYLRNLWIMAVTITGIGMGLAAISYAVIALPGPMLALGFLAVALAVICGFITADDYNER